MNEEGCSFREREEGDEEWREGFLLLGEIAATSLLVGLEAEGGDEEEEER